MISEGYSWEGRDAELQLLPPGSAWRLDCSDRWCLHLTACGNLSITCYVLKNLWMLFCRGSIYQAKSQYVLRWAEIQKVCGFHTQPAEAIVRVTGMEEREQSLTADTKAKWTGYQQEVFFQKERGNWLKECRTQSCPRKDEDIWMGIFLPGTRQNLTKSEIVRRASQRKASLK